jgi:hypothetical protein
MSRTDTLRSKDRIYSDGSKDLTIANAAHIRLKPGNRKGALSINLSETRLSLHERSRTSLATVKIN